MLYLGIDQLGQWRHALLVPLSGGGGTPE